MEQKDLEKLSERVDNLERSEREREQGREEKLIFRWSLITGIISTTIGFAIFGHLSKENMHIQKMPIIGSIFDKKYQPAVNQNVISWDMVDSAILDEKGLGGYFEELSNFHIDENKIDMLNQCNALGKIKLKIDNAKQDQSDNQEKNLPTISNKVLKEGLAEAEEYMENVIFYDNKDLPTHYSITFTSIDEKAFIEADTTYKISDSFVADTIRCYVTLQEQGKDSANYIEEYDQLIDGLLKMAFCEVSLESNFFENQVKLLDTPKTYVKK